MEFLAEYGLFAAKVVTLAVVIVLLVGAIVAAVQKEKATHDDDGELQVKRLNERFNKLKEAMTARMLAPHERKQWDKERKKKEKDEQKARKKGAEAAAPKPRVFVLDFHGDLKAGDTESLRQSITAVLGVAEPGKDEVVVRLESAGGMVHAYGLAAAQLDRIKSKGIRLTACVDKVAASGGYMMACVADRIIASPFAILGSIGVVAQLPNFHRLLQKNEIDFEVLTAGEHKRTLTVFGENTEKGRQKFLADLEDIHVLFKDYVQEHRPVVDVAQVANGDIWFGRRALEVNLADELKTSDEYLLDRCDDAELVQVTFRRKRTVPEKLGLAAASMAEQVGLKLDSMLRGSRWQ
ncbi:MAG: protease SohB [Marinobacter sp.]|nr:protease SohB [Marinobacter sp.]